MTAFKTGQKWISNAEPELGMGRILRVEHRLITIQFDLVDEVRTYAKDQAPLTRVKFNPGDVIRTCDDIEITIDQVSERDNLFFYRGNYRGTDTAILETDLDPNVTFSKPEERLFTHQFDDNKWFNLRYLSLQQRARLSTSAVKGLTGPRVALIPHQFYIAREVASRYAPRVLLADEVGLGKTIEAGLVMHQQLASGMASRILVIVPPALTFQWFVEMIRRFNLQFTLLDEERCQLIEADNETEDLDESSLDNPFEAQQLVLCSLDLFTQNPDRIEQAMEGEWDLVVVDEAHHLQWHDGEPGPDYLAVQLISQFARGLLLLTATPEQLGRLGHFSRLRLLDPSRYHDYEAFLAEEQEYEEVAHLVTQVEAGHPVLSEEARRIIRQRLGDTAPENDDALVDTLLDRHGTGRVLFRNVRESVAGFPDRKLVPAELDSEGFPPARSAGWQSTDPRINWLIDLVNASTEKFLVICSEPVTAITLEKYLREKTTIRSTAFHEHLDLVARDRSANYFADSERGAQVMVCSEIGSEGRNFQFAHNLVMFDLPDNPDLLEQRIGRLDRIGQQHEVIIHVPWAPGTEQERLMRLFDEGLSVFTAPNAAAQTVFDNLLDTESASLDELIRTAAENSQSRLADLRSGRDRLLELNSHRPAVSATLIEAVQKVDNDNQLSQYMEASFDLFGLESDPLSETTFRVKPTEGMVRNESVSLETQGRYRYPELPDDGLVYTYDRDTALSREDVQFMTWEHPVVEQALDLVISNTTGNNTVVVVKIKGVRTGTLLVETLHVIECVAPARLAADRYLPPAVLRSLITPDLKEISENVPFNEWPNQLDASPDGLAKLVAQQESGIRKMLGAADTSAQARFAPVRQIALTKMNRQLGSEVSRLRALSEINPNVRQEEVAYMAQSQTQLSESISAAQIRLDAVRLIIAA
jgi:ATP-dependent helicase HepA